MSTTNSKAKLPKAEIHPIATALPPKSNKTLFESQQIAPSPSQTYFQVIVNQTHVILRDWPKKRFRYIPWD